MFSRLFIVWCTVLLPTWAHLIPYNLGGTVIMVDREALKYNSPLLAHLENGMPKRNGLEGDSQSETFETNLQNQNADEIYTAQGTGSQFPEYSAESDFKKNTQGNLEISVLDEVPNQYPLPTYHYERPQPIPWMDAAGIYMGEQKIPIQPNNAPSLYYSVDNPNESHVSETIHKIITSLNQNTADIKLNDRAPVPLIPPIPDAQSFVNPVRNAHFPAQEDDLSNSFVDDSFSQGALSDSDFSHFDNSGLTTLGDNFNSDGYEEFSTVGNDFNVFPTDNTRTPQTDISDQETTTGFGLLQTVQADSENAEAIRQNEEDDINYNSTAVTTVRETTDQPDLGGNTDRPLEDQTTAIPLDEILTQKEEAIFLSLQEDSEIIKEEEEDQAALQVAMADIFGSLFTSETENLETEENESTSTVDTESSVSPQNSFVLNEEIPDHEKEVQLDSDTTPVGDSDVLRLDISALSDISDQDTAQDDKNLQVPSVAAPDEESGLSILNELEKTEVLSSLTPSDQVTSEVLQVANDHYENEQQETGFPLPFDILENGDPSASNIHVESPSQIEVGSLDTSDTTFEENSYLSTDAIHQNKQQSELQIPADEAEEDELYMPNMDEPENTQEEGGFPVPLDFVIQEDFDKFTVHNLEDLQEETDTSNPDKAENAYGAGIQVLPIIKFQEDSSMSDAISSGFSQLEIGSSVPLDQTVQEESAFLNNEEHENTHHQESALLTDTATLHNAEVDNDESLDTQSSMTGTKEEAIKSEIFNSETIVDIVEDESLDALPSEADAKDETVELHIVNSETNTENVEGESHDAIDTVTATKDEDVVLQITNSETNDDNINKVEQNIFSTLWSDFPNTRGEPEKLPTTEASEELHYSPAIINPLPITADQAAGVYINDEKIYNTHASDHPSEHSTRHEPPEHDDGLLTWFEDEPIKIFDPAVSGASESQSTLEATQSDLRGPQQPSDNEIPVGLPGTVGRPTIPGHIPNPGHRPRPANDDDVPELSTLEAEEANITINTGGAVFHNAVPDLLHKSTCRCGLRFNQKIVGGDPTTIDQYPWMAGITSKSDHFTFCGGSLLNDQYVLTAAHCLYQQFPEDIYVRFGETTRDNHKSFNVDVERIIIHPKYDINIVYKADIGLIKLKTPIPSFTDKIFPVCIASGRNNYANANGKISGWGRNSFGGDVTQGLMEATVKVLSTKTCRKDSYYQKHEVHKKVMCALGSGIDACQGDSGGPLVVLEGDQYVHVGTVSWGIGCAQKEYPGIYTRTTSYSKWIRNMIKDGNGCSYSKNMKPNKDKKKKKKNKDKNNKLQLNSILNRKKKPNVRLGSDSEGDDEPAKGNKQKKKKNQHNKNRNNNDNKKKTPIDAFKLIFGEREDDQESGGIKKKKNPNKDSGVTEADQDFKIDVVHVDQSAADDTVVPDLKVKPNKRNKGRNNNNKNRRKNKNKNKESEQTIGTDDENEETPEMNLSKAEDIPITENKNKKNKNNGKRNEEADQGDAESNKKNKKNNQRNGEANEEDTGNNKKNKKRKKNNQRNEEVVEEGTKTNNKKKKNTQRNEEAEEENAGSNNKNRRKNKDENKDENKEDNDEIDWGDLHSALKGIGDMVAGEERQN